MGPLGPSTKITFFIFRRPFSQLRRTSLSARPRPWSLRWAGARTLRGSLRWAPAGSCACGAGMFPHPSLPPSSSFSSLSFLVSFPFLLCHISPASLGTQFALLSSNNFFKRASHTLDRISCNHEIQALPICTYGSLNLSLNLPKQDSKAKPRRPNKSSTPPHKSSPNTFD